MKKSVMRIISMLITVILILTLSLNYNFTFASVSTLESMFIGYNIVTGTMNTGGAYLRGAPYENYTNNPVYFF